MKPIFLISIYEPKGDIIPEITRAQLDKLEEKLEDFLWDEGEGFHSVVRSISIKSPLGIAIRRLRD